MKTFIKIVGDTKDADYVTKFMEVEPSDLDVIKRMAKLVGCSDYNYLTSDHVDSDDYYERKAELEDRGIDIDYLSKIEVMYYDNLDDLEIFDKYVPRGEYGIHTIINMELYSVSNVESL